MYDALPPSGRWGKLSLGQDLAPAIALASNGIGVSETDAENWKTYGQQFSTSPGFAHVFWPNGDAPKSGDLFRNPELAATYTRIGEHGREEFCKGQTARAILKLERAQDGFLQADDLAGFQPEWGDPVSTTYHGWTVYEMPPNGQGVAALSMLNLMEHYPIAE